MVRAERIEQHHLALLKNSRVMQCRTEIGEIRTEYGILETRLSEVVDIDPMGNSQ